MTTPAPASTGVPAGWYPVNPSQLGYWDGTTWSWLPPPVLPTDPVGEPLRDVPQPVSVWACVLGVAAAVGLSLVSARVVHETDLPDWSVLVAGFVPIWLGLCLGCAVAAQRSSVSFVESLNLPRSRRGWLRAIGIGVLAGGAMRVGAGVLAAPFIPLIDREQFGGIVGQVAPTYAPASGALLAVFAVGAIVGAPILEEAFFRNVLQPTLVRRWAVGVAIGVQAALFSLAHLSFDATWLQNGMTATVILAVGVALGALRHWSRTIVTCVVAHAAFNTVAVLVIVALPWLDELSRGY